MSDDIDTEYMSPDELEDILSARWPALQVDKKFVMVEPTEYDALKKAEGKLAAVRELLTSNKGEVQLLERMQKQYDHYSKPYRESVIKIKEMKRMIAKLAAILEAENE